MSLPSRTLCHLWHQWPWHPDLTLLILVRSVWLCSELDWILSIILILPCQMWQPSIFLVLLFLWCSSGLCSWSFAFHHVHHSPQHSSLLFLSTTTFLQMTLNSSSPPFIYLTWLKHYCPSKCSTADLFLDDCQSFNSQLLQDRIPAHRPQ